VALLERFVPGRDEALVITEPELTTEILLRAQRDNLLPIANATEDDLVPALVERARAAAERIPAGTFLLTSDAPQNPAALTTFGNEAAFTEIQSAALAILQRRFEFHEVGRSADGLRMVRLEPR
jgi:hypothetical protein